jgi:hypothetical protein
MVKQIKTIALTSMTLALHNDFHSLVRSFIMLLFTIICNFVNQNSNQN